MTQNENNFELIARVATDADIHAFEESNVQVCRFAVAIEKEDSNGVKTSALMPAEMWRKNENTVDFSHVIKLANVKMTGYLKPEEWNDKNTNEPRNRVLLEVLSIETL